MKFRSHSSSATRQSVCLETVGPGSRRAPQAPVHRGSGGLALGQPLPWIRGRGRAGGGGRAHLRPALRWHTPGPELMWEMGGPGGLGDGVGVGRVGRYVAWRDGNGAWKAVKRLDRSPAARLKLPRLLQCWIHAGAPPVPAALRSPTSRAARRVRAATVLTGGLSRLPSSRLSLPRTSFSHPAPRKPACSLSGNKCSLLVAVPAVTKAATGAQRGRARTGLRRRAGAATGF